MILTHGCQCIILDIIIICYKNSKTYYNHTIAILWLIYMSWIDTDCHSCGTYEKSWYQTEKLFAVNDD